MDKGVYLCAQWKNLQTSFVQTIKQESKHILHSLLLVNYLRPTKPQWVLNFNFNKVESVYSRQSFVQRKFIIRSTNNKKTPTTSLQKVSKHVQQVAKYGVKFCAKKTYHESKHLSPPSSPSNPSFVIEQRWEGLGQPQHVLEIFSSAQVPRESATNISRSATLATTEVQHLRSFSSSRQEELFPSSSYCRLKIPLLPRSVMTFSSTVLPPLSTFSSSTTFPPSHINIFLYSLVLPQRSFSRLYCPLSTISYSCPPLKNLFLLD
jgi:hypothetical protein